MPFFAYKHMPILAYCQEIINCLIYNKQKEDNNMGCCVRSEEYTDIQKNIGKYAKALGHPARVAILELLSKKCNCICNDLVESLPLAQSTVSQHLKILKEVGLVISIEKAPSVEYHLNKDKWLEAKKMFSYLFDK
jgi:DNA-binding transcriptional ArsR family regulator